MLPPSVHFLYGPPPYNQPLCGATGDQDAGPQGARTTGAVTCLECLREIDHARYLEQLQTSRPVLVHHAEQVLIDGGDGISTLAGFVAGVVFGALVVLVLRS